MPPTPVYVAAGRESRDPRIGAFSVKPIWYAVGVAMLAALTSPAWAATTMQAAVHQGGKLVLETRELPQAGAGEVRIKVRAAGANPLDS